MITRCLLEGRDVLLERRGLGAHGVDLRGQLLDVSLFISVDRCVFIYVYIYIYIIITYIYISYHTISYITCVVAIVI